MRILLLLNPRHTNLGATRLRNLLLCKAQLLQSKALHRPVSLLSSSNPQDTPHTAFSCSASGTRSLDFRRFARRRCALQAIACSHLLKTPRYLLGHT